MPKRSRGKPLQYELWPNAKWEWRESYPMSHAELKTFWFHTFVKDGHLIWSGFCNNKGLPSYYHRVLKRKLSARRIAWFIANGPIARRYDVVAICGIKNCISARCLRRVAKGTGKDGVPTYLTNFPNAVESGR